MHAGDSRPTRHPLCASQPLAFSFFFHRHDVKFLLSANYDGREGRSGGDIVYIFYTNDVYEFKFDIMIDKQMPLQSDASASQPASQLQVNFSSGPIHMTVLINKE